MLASEGVSVVVHGRNQARTEATAARITAAGGKAVAVCADLADEAQIDALAAGALAAFGGIDILVNNAGGSAETKDKSWFGGTAASVSCHGWQPRVLKALSVDSICTICGCDVIALLRVTSSAPRTRNL